ncbi:MAG: glycosyltransferase [Actinomycetota bacterium]|nr:glycosyltransferase [Actinomycetota bacterium]
MAKAPVPGKVKTRLCPPLSPDQACEVARSALLDTLDAVAATAAGRRVLLLDGTVGPWLPDGFEVVRQRGEGLAERLANAWSDLGQGGIQIGMDTPQVTPGLLQECLRTLAGPGVDAVLGLADDGGWWAIGMRTPDPRVFSRVPMSTSATGKAQLRRLQDEGLRVALLPPLVDVDTVDQLSLVASSAPSGRFAGYIRSLGY